MMGMSQTSKYCSVCQKQTMWARQGTNHVLHLLLTALTGGLWIPVWVLCSIKIGGWRCQTCGYAGSLLSRLIVPVAGITAATLLVAIVCAALSGRPPAPTRMPIASHPQERKIAPPPENTTEQVVNKASTAVAENATTTIAVKKEDDSAKQKRKETEEAAKWRLWTDASGDHKTEAKYGGTVNGKVRLVKRSGSTIYVPIDKLSAVDREWIASRQ